MQLEKLVRAIHAYIRYGITVVFAASGIRSHYLHVTTGSRSQPWHQAFLQHAGLPSQELP